MLEYWLIYQMLYQFEVKILCKAQDSLKRIVHHNKYKNINIKLVQETAENVIFNKH